MSAFSRKIVGHERQRAELQRDLETGNIAHAYLFAGPPHIGKFTIARWFARELLLRDAPPERRERIVAEADRLLHPDLFVLDRLWIAGRSESWEDIARYSNLPQEHRCKAGARTDAISIDDVRTLQERLHETGSGTHRVCCIRSVERMQDPAANALLKMLEEPPAGRVFLLTTQAFSALLPPVVSRTRVLQFRRLSRQELQPLLTDTSDDDARFLFHVAQGAPGAVRRLRERPELLREERQMHGRAASFWQSRVDERMDILQPLLERSEEGQRLLLHLALSLRETPQAPPAWGQAFLRFVRGLETNAHRGLLVGQFALAVGPR